MTDNQRDRQRYWDEISEVEDLRAFHPEAFGSMSQQDRTALLEYYALDKEVADVYEHKCELDVREPHLSSEAARARRRLLASLGIASDQ